ncbi:MAG: hypothetical protein HYV09_03760 [Deltaproteobacteria bacterium]|nr:hypothetical protein [Deltaproteobacteria bacterium]
MSDVAKRSLLVATIVFAAGCGGSDAQFDIGELDDAVSDAVDLDAVSGDGATTDTTVDDGMVVADTDTDSALDDGALTDSAVADTGAADTGATDTGATDSGATDTGAIDSGATDTGTTSDAGCTAGTSRACYGGASTDVIGGTSACKRGLEYCIGGAWGPCTGEVRPSPESCNNVDDDCDGVVDDGLGNVGCGVGACTRVVAACSSGSATTCVPGAPTGEVCGNSQDDDCDGVVDNGCGCVHVAPTGVDGTTCGSAATPCRSIQYASNKAGTSTWPKQVCVGGNVGCNTAASTATYNEAVTMKDGVSVLGSYNPATTGFSRHANCVTRIAAQDHNGVVFPATVTSATTLDGFVIDGRNDPTNAAVTITGSTGAILDGCVVNGAGGTSSVGVLVTAASGTKATPRIQNSAITGGSGSASAIGIRVVGSSPVISRNCDTYDSQGRCQNWGCYGTQRFVRGRINGNTGATGSVTYAIRLESSPSTTIDTSAVCSSSGQGDVAGVRLSGDATGTIIRASNIVAPGGATGNVNAVGVWADACAGASPWILGNYGISAQSRTAAGRADGVRAVGDCHPRVDSNRQIVGGEESAANDAIGVYCARDATTGVASRCTILGNQSILGSQAGFPPSSTGVRCDRGACARIERNAMISGAQGINTFGLVLDGAATFVDRNVITGGCTRGEGIGLLSIGSAARVQNNAILGGTDCSSGAPTSAFGVKVLIGGGLGELDLHSNSIVAGGTTSAACTSRGLGLDLLPSSTPGGGRGVFRNNVILAGVCSTAYGVLELNASADPRIFENNDLFGFTSAVVLYRNENTTNLPGIGAVNALTDMTVAANVSSNPLFFSSSNFHIQAGSPCRNAGTASGAPTYDYDADGRPLESAHDIGFDEYRP